MEKEYEEIQQEISEIAETAAESRRQLTDDEVKRLEELFGQLETVNNKALELFQENQKAVQNYILANGNMSVEEMASYSKAAAETAQETQNAIEKNFNESALAIKNLLGAAFDNASAQLTVLKDSQINQVKETTSTTYNLLLTNSLKQSGLYNRMTAEFTEYTQKMKSIQDIYNEQNKQSTQDNYGATLGAFLSYRISQKQLNEEFNSEFLTKNQEFIATYLGIVEQMISAGGRLDDENMAVVRSIIDAYKTLPKSSSDAWSETLNGIIAKINEYDLENKGKSVGHDFNRGIKSGLESNESDVYKKVGNIGMNMQKEIISKLQIRSPSKKAKWIAEMFDLGLVAGLEKREQEIYDKSSEIASGITENLQIKSDFDIDTQLPKLASRYAASVAASNAMQAVYHQTYINNNSSANYYSTYAAGGNTVNEEIRNFRVQLISLLNSAFSESDNILTERQAGRIIRKCLKSVGM